MNRLLVSLVFLLVHLNVQAEVVTAVAKVGTSIASGIAVGKIIKDIDGRITGQIGYATSNGEYLVEKSGRQLQALLLGMDQILGKNLDKTFDQLNKSEQDLLKSLDKMVSSLEHTKSEILDAEHFLAMDIANIAASLPGVPNGYQFPLREVKGYSLNYQSSGIYRIELIGQAFDIATEATVSLWSGDKEQSLAIRPITKHNELQIEIPSALLNDGFSDNTISRVPLNVKVSKVEKLNILQKVFGRKPKKDQVLNYSIDILLLPKFPVVYDIVQVVAGKGWSEEIFSTTGSAKAAATGESGRWRTYTVSVDIPNDALMEKTLTSRRLDGVGAGSWGNWASGYSYANENGNGPVTVSTSFAHQIHDQDRTLYITAHYRKPVVLHGRKPVVLRDPIDNVEKQGHLAYEDLYVGNLEKDAITYYARIRFFNGRTVTLSEGDNDPTNTVEINRITKNTAKYDVLHVRVKKT